MPRTRTALAAVVLGLVVSPLAGTSQAADDGCVTEWATSGHYGPAVEQVVVRHPDGSVTVNPNPVTGYAGYLVSDVGALVACVV
jgi:hypothetical protein